MGKQVDTSMRRPPADEADAEQVDDFVSGGTSEAGETDADQERETERISIYFTDATAKRLRMYAAEQGRPMSRVVDDMVAGELEDWTPDL
jgi:hypothetical protein